MSFLGEDGEDGESFGDDPGQSSEFGNPPFPPVLSPQNLQIKLQISLSNLPSPTMSSPIAGQFPQTSTERTGESNIPEPGQMQGWNASQIREMPQIISVYDSLPTQLKSYFLLHLLKRSPVMTLQFVLSLVTPTLKRDFIALLPQEICFKVLSYLDICTLGRCHGVSRKWYKLLTSPTAQTHLWIPRLDAARWLPEQLCSNSFVDENIDSNSKDYYKDLYRGHYTIQQNWLRGRYKQISFPGHSFNVVTCLQFDSRRIVSGSDDQTIHVYDINTGTLIRRLHGHDGGVWALQYWNDLLVSGSTDRTVRVWDMDTGECTHILEGHTSTVRCLMIVIPSYCHIARKTVPERPLIVTGSRDSTLRVWVLPTSRNESGNGEQGLSNLGSSDQDAGRRERAAFGRQESGNPHFLHLLQGHTNSVRTIAGKCNVLVSGSYDCTVRSWDLETGKCMSVFRGHREKVYSVDYCHQLQRAASGSMDSTVRVWCTRTGTCLFFLEGHTSLVGLLEMSPQFLVSAAADATLRIWSTETGQCLANLAGHTAAITCFHHDPRFNRVISGSEGGIKAWELCSDPSVSNSAPDISRGESSDRSMPVVNSLQAHSSSKPVYGKFISDLIVCVQGVWRVKMSERHLISAVQKEEGKTWFEVLDFGVGVATPTTPNPTSSQ